MEMDRKKLFWVRGGFCQQVMFEQMPEFSERRASQGYGPGFR